MAATVTASIASLILKLDDPNRDDLAGVIVWGSTVNGFTPGVSNVLYKGNSLTITLGNLTPLTTYYLRYAYVSQIEPDNYEISEQLSGVPSKIDGSIIVDGSITAPQINATALRGKTVSGGVFVDGGSVVTADVAKPTDVTTTTTIYLEDTSDFPAAGAAFVVVRAGQIRSSASVVRYTGKTGTSLTGVSGIGVAISKGTVITPMPLPSFPLSSYAGGSTISLEGSPISLVGPTTSPDTAYDFMFRANGGSAIAISTVAVADQFTYTAGHYWMSSPGIYVSRLDGVTGLASFSVAAKSERIIIDDISIPKTVVATTGSKTSLTLTASTGYLNPNGGTVILASTTVSGLMVVDYSSYSGTTVTLSLATTITAATYYVIPLFSFNVYGAAQFPLFATSNTRYGLWTKSVIGPSRNITKNMLDSLELRPQSGNAIYIAPSQSAALDNDGAPVVIEASDRYLHIDLRPIASTAIDTTLMSTEAAFCLGAAMYASSGYNSLVAYDSISNSVLQYQPIGSTLRFSKYDAANLDAITFDDANNVFSFDADGGSGNAGLFAGRLGIGSVSTSALINITAPITGASNSLGVSLSSTINASVTTAAYGFRSSLAADAGANLGNIYHFIANQGGVTANGATVSAQHGFVSNGSLVDADTNIGFWAQNTAAVVTGKLAYGFYSSINIATGGGDTWAFYGQGTAWSLFNGPIIQADVPWVNAPAHTSKSAAATLTGAELKTQIISCTGTSYTLTLPTGANIDAAFSGIPATTSVGFDFHIINGASGIVTIAVNTGISAGGASTLTVAAGASAHFRLRRSGAATYVLYRLA